MWPFKSKAKVDPSALTIFQSLENQRGLLNEPVEVGQKIHQSCNPTELFAWGIFNPYGPTLAVLSLLEHDESKAALVHHRMLNPFSQTSHVMAVVDRGVSPKDLREFLSVVFAQNEIGDSSLIVGLPSFMLFGKTKDTVETCLSCFESHVAENDRMKEVIESLDTFRKFPGNPWDRATGDIERARRGILDQRTGSHLPADSNASVEFDAKQFVAWVECLLSDEHRLPEMQGFFQAWDGSINFQKGNDLAKSAMNTREMITLLTQSCLHMALQLAVAIQPSSR
jgi:hypothetical protein